MPGHLRRLACFAVLALLALPARAAEEPLLVFAAASLKTALDEGAGSFGKAHGNVSVSYAASSALAKQIENGAPADVFISADLDWMSYLEGKTFVAAGSAQQMLGNDIVLVAPADSKVTLSIEPGFNLASALDGGKLAMADTASVPAGKYGKASLVALGAWDGVSAQVVQTENVRAALKLVALKEAALGIVYASDARAEPRVRVVGTFPTGSHPPIIYPVAALSRSSHPQTQAFLDFLRSDEMKAVFEKNGFKVLPR